MADQPRIYRAGLGLPPAVVIRSAPGPSRLSYHTYLDPDPEPSASEDGDSTVEPRRYGAGEADTFGARDRGWAGMNEQRAVHQDTLPRETVWREWNTNPSLHGPPRLVAPPTFVPSTQNYDELGRTIDDGVEVVVDRGAAMDNTEGKADGEEVKGWYLALSGNGSGISTPARKDDDETVMTSRKGSNKIRLGDDKGKGKGRGFNTFSSRMTHSTSNEHGPTSRRSKDHSHSPTINDVPSHSSTAQSAGVERDTTTIDLTGDSDEEDGEEPGTQCPNVSQRDPLIPSTSVSAPSTRTPRSPSGSATPTVTAPPLKVHSSEWFIRRALLRQSLSTDPATEQPRSTPNPSISSMLNIPSVPKKRKVQPTYALGPENKGYSILRDRLGWEGGGLGRPDGWEGAAAGPSTAAHTRLRGEAGDDGAAEVGAEVDREDVKGDIVTEVDLHDRALESPAGEVGDHRIIELDINGQPIVDLTISDSNSDSGSDSGQTEPIDDLHSYAAAEADAALLQPAYGPGRTAPISTTLKMDRYGLGHRHTNPAKRKHYEKKVTHSAAEIERAQRAGRHGHGHVHGHGQGLELGKKGKIKWKERDRKDRDERKRLAAALNS